MLFVLKENVKYITCMCCWSYGHHALSYLSGMLKFSLRQLCICKFCWFRKCNDIVHADLSFCASRWGAFYIRCQGYPVRLALPCKVFGIQYSSVWALPLFFGWPRTSWSRSQRRDRSMVPAGRRCWIRLPTQRCGWSAGFPLGSPFGLGCTGGLRWWVASRRRNADAGPCLWPRRGARWAWLWSCRWTLFGCMRVFVLRFQTSFCISICHRTLLGGARLFIHHLQERLCISKTAAEKGYGVIIERTVHRLEGLAALQCGMNARHKRCFVSCMFCFNSKSTCACHAKYRVTSDP